MTAVERTHRWRAAYAFTLFTSTSGLYLEDPLVLLTSLLGVAYAGYPLLVGPPTVDLDLSRTVSAETPSHGDSVTVTVSVTNTGSATLADLRIIDGVPALLAVTNGTPRHTATLRPGATATFQYTIAAKHGSHRFTPATVIAHDISGNVRVETEVAAGEPTMMREGRTLECTVDLRAFQLRRQARQFPGQTPTGSSGDGLEFQQTRSYQRGDPVNRIDWKQFARSGDLTTVEFREEHRTAVVLCIDARPEAMRAAEPTDPHAVAYCVAAARQVLSTLEQRSDRVGVAVFGTEFDWLAPSAGHQQYTHAEQLLLSNKYDRPAPIDDQDATGRSTAQLQQLLAQTRENLEVVVFSPLVDAFGETAVQQLDANGHAVTVISPDVTTKTTASAEFAGIERTNRVQALRNQRVPVADWSPEKPLFWPVGHHRGS
ncbi:DUF58 domain-containing protein [Natrinema ejinorense]|uniref:DUF58 domain-containing protein n=1 Tax=Natrinema ejinorense TaxID=373386 RepID=A0A2A5QPM4_9EURY|nr:DUF58 domain-containing protein [Natrinema ejinorense]PCR88787.1 DUF58 domain-containing protein [Natrinema ejinorense]